MKRLVSINILSTNEQRFLPRCISCAKAQTYEPIELTVIDNASTDGTAEYVKQHHPDLRLLINPTNLGYCGGHNRGFAEAKGEFLLPLNSDVFMTPTFIAEKVKAMQSDERIGMVEGKLLAIPSQEAKLPEKRVLDGTGVLLTQARRNFERAQGQFDVGQYEELEEVFGASGAAPLYRREMLQELVWNGEYFDETFFIYRDEVDLAWRAQWLGWKCLYTPYAEAYHVRGYTRKKRKNLPKRLRLLQIRNRYLMLMKNEVLVNLLPDLLPILWFEIRQWLYIPFFEPYLLKIIPELIRLRPQMKAKRQRIMNTRKVKPQEIAKWFF